MGSMDFVTRDFMLICSEIAGCLLITSMSIIDPRLYETALNICHLWRHRIRGIRYSWFHADAVYLQWDCRLFIYHVHESLTDPCLYKVDHCCLSLSRALASCSCFQLCYFVTERQVSCCLSWHASPLFCALLASGRYSKPRQSLTVMRVSRMLQRFLLTSV